MASRDFTSQLSVVDPPDARAWHRRASLAATQVFPPNLELAASSIQEAIRREPLSGPWWVFLARYRLLAGRQEEARAALEFSHALDKSFPAQQLEAISLWRILGEEERALAIAREYVAQTPDQLFLPAERLLRAGFTPEETIAAVLTPTAKPREVASLIRNLAPVLGPATAAQFRAPIRRHAADAEFRSMVMPQLLKSPVDPLVLDLWRLDSEASGARIQIRDGLAVESLPGGSSPQIANRHLGWQRPRGTSGRVGVSIRDDAGGRHFVVEYGDSPDWKDHSFAFHRGLYANPDGALLVLRAQVMPADRSALSPHIGVGNSTVRPTTSTLEGTTMTWTYLLPPLEDLSVVEFHLRRSRVGPPRAPAPIVALEPFPTEESEP